MNIEASNVKGFQDFLPPESLKRESVRKVIEKYFQLYGFFPIETPIVEFDELMKPSTLPTEQEDEAVSERFRLKDRAGRNLGLRYEFTFQLARIFKQNPNAKLPFKRYQIGPVFRDEPIGADRFRQFTQCDADIVGSQSTGADAECLALLNDILKELKIPAEIQVNNRKLLSAIIESLQISAVKEVMRELDKISKIGEDNVKTNLRRYADSNKVLTLFKLLEKDLSFFKENAFDGAAELEELQEECSLYGIKIKFNPFMIRGFGYYTGNIFEAVVEDKNSVAAGGRYDKVVGKYIGRDIPAVGISFGLDRLAQIAKLKADQIPLFLLISIEQDSETIKLAKKLRKANISCSVMSDKPGKALEYANAYEIPYSIFIGPEEIDKGKFKLRDMKSGEEKYLTEKQLLAQFGSDK
jgi:histidyl-tRNA synthetase